MGRRPRAHVQKISTVKIAAMLSRRQQRVMGLHGGGDKCSPYAEIKSFPRRP
jgi:hypothetical protein